MIISYDYFKVLEGLQVDAQADYDVAEAHARRLRRWVDSGFGISVLEPVIGVRQMARQRSVQGMLHYRLYDIYRPENEAFIRARLSRQARRKRSVHNAVKRLIDRSFDFPDWFRVDWAAESLTNDLVIQTDVRYDETPAGI